MKKIFLIILVLVILLGGYYFLAKKGFFLEHSPNYQRQAVCPIGTKLETVCLNSYPTQCNNICSDGSEPR